MMYIYIYIYIYICATCLLIALSSANRATNHTLRNIEQARSQEYDYFISASASNHPIKMQPIHAFTIAALALTTQTLATSTPTNWLGIKDNNFQADCSHTSVNCRTSHVDAGGSEGYEKKSHVMFSIWKLLSNVPNGTQYGNGKHIACYLHGNGPHGFCLFYENLSKGHRPNIVDTRNSLNAMLDRDVSRHEGCRGRCGRGWPKQWAHGYLKLDYVTNSCDGLCK